MKKKIHAMCAPVRERFSDYLDGDINGLEMQQVEAHLHTCPACRLEFEEWQSIQQALSASAATPPPADLALRLRVALSHERVQTEHTFAERMTERWELFRDNTLRPFAVQGTVAAAAVLSLAMTFGVLGIVAAPTTVEANDEPLAGFSSPRYLYSAEGSASETPISIDGLLLVEAQISASGRVYDYRILSGPADSATQDLLRQKMMNAIYEPAQVFGVPVRSHVLLTFSGISVRG